MHYRYKLYLLLIILFPFHVFADAASPHPVSPTAQANAASTVLVPGVVMHPAIPQYVFAGFNISGYVSGSYNYLSQSPYFTSGYPDRLYDLNKNGLTLQEASLTIARQPEQGFGGLLNPILGSDANQLAAYGMKPAFDSQNLALDLTQAYLQYAYHALTTIGGRFYGLAGYESIPPQNSNFSSSYIAIYAEPTTVTGVRGTYAINDHVNVAVGVNDGWDVITDWGRPKTIELGAWYTDDKRSFSVYLYNGGERASFFVGSGPVGNRTLVDLIGLVNITDKLTLVGNYDYVTQSQALLPTGDLSRAVWQGFVGYVQYQWNSQWRTSVRGEYFIDHDGFVTGIRQNLKELTLTVGYLILKQLELRAEARHDISNVSSFASKNGSSNSKNMQSFALEGVFTF